jgi:phenylacetate-coenzyme A ligase PaaK-like adenylate-forming protein
MSDEFDDLDTESETPDDVQEWLETCDRILASMGPRFFSVDHVIARYGVWIKISLQWGHASSAWITPTK